MKITVEKIVLGITGRLTFEANTDEDLSKQDVDPRIQRVLSRECERFSQIVAVGLKDKAAAVVEAARVASIPPENRGPAQTLAAGTKKQDTTGRVVATQ